MSSEYRKRRKRVVEKDTEFYMEVWNERDHVCIECGKYLGEVPSRDMFSHLLTKGAHPLLRRVKENIAIKCAPCHHRWEFGDRLGMKIYEGFREKRNELLEIERKMSKSSIG